MKTTVLNYRIVVEPDEQTGTGKPGYTAFCPTLGVAEDGDTVEEALTRIKSLFKFHLECLAEEGKPIPAPDISLTMYFTRPVLSRFRASSAYVGKI